MIRPMGNLADLHVHSIRSGHAYSTLGEISTALHESHYEIWASTDHIYNTGSTIDRLNEITYFVEMGNSKICDGTLMIPGIEGNLFQIFDGCGVPLKKIEELNAKVPWRLVGIHSWFIDKHEILNVSDLPSVFEGTLRPDFHGIIPTTFAHIERELERFKFDSNIPIDQHVEEALAGIVDVAIKHDIFLEINNSSLRRNSEALIKRMKFWVRYAADHGAKFCFGSDAHCAADAGDFRLLNDFLGAIDIGTSYVLNYDRDALMNLYGMQSRFLINR